MTDQDQTTPKTAQGSAPLPAPATLDEPSSWQRARRWLVGSPRSLTDRSLFHRLSLIPFLAWVGLGADGLSSSAYGPEEAFRQLGEHTYLAVILAAVMTGTVLLISFAYSRIIEEFPHGGGGYVVATKLLGERLGVVSGSALLVDYVLTITVSIAAAGDALFSFVPPVYHDLKLPCEALVIFALILLNIRGVRESVLVLTPIFLVFVATHAAVIGWGIFAHAGQLPETGRELAAGFERGRSTLGVAGMLLLFLHAYSLGGGTYTGIEAVSNGIAMMREPRVQTARRTMAYMAVSLACTASGLLLCYLLWHVGHVEGRTMNAVLVEEVAGAWPRGHLFALVTVLSEGALLVVAAQAGFLDGPRVLANMAVDSWMPRRFSALSDRLTTQNGIVLMGAASLGALLYARGDVRHIVVMYSINVFLTFSLSMLAMALAWRARKRRTNWRMRTALFTTAFLLCATILVVTVHEKFNKGGWITLAVTGSVVLLSFAIRRHYRKVAGVLTRLYSELGNLAAPAAVAAPPPGEPDPLQPTAAVLVGNFGGLGIHTTLNIFRSFPGHFRAVVFLSVGVIDSGGFKGEESVGLLRAQTQAFLDKYVELVRGLGIPATSRMALGTDAVDEAQRLCLGLAREFPQTTFFAGKVIFERERWYQRLLHNETAYAIQKRLQWAGRTMVIIPARVSL